MTGTYTSTYTTVDIENVMRKFKTDLLMLAESSAAMEASHAREIADDIFKLARDGYISYVDITLLQYGVEKRAVRYTVMESGSDLAGSRPGGVVWERLPAAELRVVIDRTSKWNALPQGERDGIARSLKRHWGLIYDDLSPCQPAFPVVVVTSPATIMPSRERTSANDYCQYLQRL